MKRERNDFENELSLNTIKKSERVIDKDNKQKHTVWCLTQGQKHLNKIIKEYCSLCNRRSMNKSSLNIEKVKCGYCDRSTCDNASCKLSECSNCELIICNLCGNYNYGNNANNNSIYCPNCK
ncbi:Cd27 binding protein (Siva) [Cryptosporidium meleagridis]